MCSSDLFHFTGTFQLALVLSALTLSSFLRLEAKQVSPQQALNIARKYITPDRRSSLTPKTRGDNQPTAEPFYVFNDMRGKGFVVVSGDDGMGEILAYSDAGKLDTLNANPGVKLLLQSYRESFAELQRASVTTKPGAEIGRAHV